MARPTGKIAVALAENREASKQWAAFQLSEDHEKAMRERFRAEKKSQRKKKLEGSKAESKGPLTAKRSPKVRMTAVAHHRPAAVVEHATAKPATEAVKPSDVVTSTEGGDEGGDGSSVATAVNLDSAGHLSASHVASPIKFPRKLLLGVDASKEGGPRESAVALKLRKEVEDLKVCVG